MEHGERRQVKLSVRIMTLISNAAIDWESMSIDLLQNLAVRSWQALSELATRRPQVLAPHISELVGHARQLFSQGTKSGLTPSKTRVELKDLPDDAQCMILAVRCLRNLLLSLCTLDRDLEVQHLRVVAPMLVEWIAKLDIQQVQYVLVKAVIYLVPRPTATTVVKNLEPLIRFVANCAPLFRDKLVLTVFRQYTRGKIGMIYLAVPILSLDQSNRNTVGSGPSQFIPLD